MEKEVNYHSNDFNYDDYTSDITNKYDLPDITTYNGSNIEYEKWNSFYSNHSSGLFYKPRRYLIKEFYNYLPIHANNDNMTFIEIGCGYGCSIFPLLSYFNKSCKIIACDYSKNALDILKMNDIYINSKLDIIPLLWDITAEISDDLICKCDVLLCVFVISSIHPNLHYKSIYNIYNSLKSGGLFLFRDYAVYDMTMFRHKIRYDTALFRRDDGTLVYYFDKESFISLVTSIGFQIIELEYATVINRNRNNKKVMNRIFLHAVLKKN